MKLVRDCSKEIKTKLSAIGVMIGEPNLMVFNQPLEGCNSYQKKYLLYSKNKTLLYESP